MRENATRITRMRCLAHFVQGLRGGGGYERARESEVVKGRQKQGKRVLLENTHRYDSDSLGSSMVWRARESLEGEEMNVIGESECRRVRERREENEKKRERKSKD